MDTRPEDLLITPVIDREGGIRYVASSLVTAMIRGGVAIVDEGNRMSEKSWASLAPLLDNRRYVESIVAGVKVRAHPDFRFVATMNDDASTYELPEYIHSRLQPQIQLDFPEHDEEKAILAENLPVRRRRDPRVRDGVPSGRARGRRALHGARRHQHRALRVEATEGRRPRRYRRRVARRRRARRRRRRPPVPVTVVLRLSRLPAALICVWSLSSWTASAAPRSFELLYRAAMRAESAGKWDEAYEDWQKLHEIAPDNPFSSYQAASSAAKLGRTDEAFAWLEKAVPPAGNGRTTLERTNTSFLFAKMRAGCRSFTR